MIYKYTLEGDAPVEVTVTLHDLILLKALTVEADKTGDCRYHYLDKALQETIDKANKSYFHHFSWKERATDDTID